MSYDYSLIDPGYGRVITLGREYLPQLGITWNQDSLIYTKNLDGGSIHIEVTQVGMSSGLILDSTLTAQESGPDLIYAYDRRFTKGTKILPHNLFNPEDSISHDQLIDLCIPIQFRSTPDEIGYTTTFWFYSDERLFSVLPDSLAIPMRLEYVRNVRPVLKGSTIASKVNYYITGVRVDTVAKKTEQEDPVPCEFFPSFCEGLPGLQNLNVYPNPTTGTLNLELLLSESKTIDIRVFDLAGRVVNEELERKEYEATIQNREQLDLSHLQSGFYLLVLTDEQGARLTKRIVKN